VNFAAGHSCPGWEHKQPDFGDTRPDWSGEGVLAAFAAVHEKGMRVCAYRW